MVKIFDIIFYCYADDSQLYLSIDPDESSQPFSYRAGMSVWRIALHCRTENWRGSFVPAEIRLDNATCCAALFYLQVLLLFLMVVV